jgi:hypothetical protein
MYILYMYIFTFKLVEALKLSVYYKDNFSLSYWFSYLSNYIS